MFHRVPDDLRGTTLYPLNELAEIHPDLYRYHRQRYATREDIAALRIPPLGYCLWNDVLHLTPVHPETLAEALEAAGHALPPDWRRFYRIDATLLDPGAAVIYHSVTPLWSGRFDVAQASEAIALDCSAFNAEELENFRTVPDEACRYFASVPVGSPFPLFLNVPHVFYKGRIDLTQPGVQIIEV